MDEDIPLPFDLPAVARKKEKGKRRFRWRMHHLGWRRRGSPSSCGPAAIAVTVGGDRSAQQPGEDRLLIVGKVRFYHAGEFRC